MLLPSAATDEIVVPNGMPVPFTAPPVSPWEPGVKVAPLLQTNFLALAWISPTATRWLFGHTLSCEQLLPGHCDPPKLMPEFEYRPPSSRTIAFEPCWYPTSVVVASVRIPRLGLDPPPIVAPLPGSPV